MKRQPTSFSRKRGLEAASSGRDGIALIAVLGFLSVLILMAVAFLMNMRTERLVAESSKDDVRTRQLVHSAVASAMDSVDGFMDSGARVRMPVNYAVFESTNGTTSLGTDVELISGQVTNWLPQHFRPGGQYDARWIEQNSARWVLVQDGVHGEILGRYAFLVMDCTGMMDVNLVTNPATRGEGRTIAEVDSQFLPEVGDVASARILFRSRTNCALFGTFPEIVNLSGLTRPVNNLIPYSLCYDSGWWNGSQWVQTGIGFPPVPICVQEWSQTDALRVFQGLGYPNAVDMAVCFKDYVDTDLNPGGEGAVNPSILCGEPIPMINEIILTNELIEAGETLTHNAYIDVELWYPFVGYTNNRTYTVDVSATFVCNPTALLPPSPINAPSVNNFQAMNGPIQILRCGPFTVSTNGIPAGTSVRFGARVTGVRVLDGSQAVDSTPNLSSKPIGIIQVTPAGGTVRGFGGISVLDPRINHDVARWSTLGISPGATNSGYPGLGISDNGDREGTSMYVRNSNMLSVAELGFIPTGLPWTTIDLFSSQGMDLLTKFRATTNLVVGARIYTNGLVNPNTLYTNVLKAIFRDVALNDFPGGSSAMAVDNTMADDIVASVYADGTSTYESAAGWVTTEAFRSGGTLSGPLYANPPYNMNNTKKESVIRSSYQLFNPNQQLFTIVVVAQSINDHGDMGRFDGEDIDVVVGEKRAVALVWRDPFPGPSGRHEMFVKLFKYLDE